MVNPALDPPTGLITRLLKSGLKACPAPSSSVTVPVVLAALPKLTTSATRPAPGTMDVFQLAAWFQAPDPMFQEAVAARAEVVPHAKASRAPIHATTSGPGLDRQVRSAYLLEPGE